MTPPPATATATATARATRPTPAPDRRVVPDRRPPLRVVRDRPRREGSPAVGRRRVAGDHRGEPALGRRRPCSARPGSGPVVGRPVRAVDRAGGPPPGGDRRGQARDAVTHRRQGPPTGHGAAGSDESVAPRPADDATVDAERGAGDDDYDAAEHPDDIDRRDHIDQHRFDQHRFDQHRFDQHSVDQCRRVGDGWDDIGDLRVVGSVSPVRPAPPTGRRSGAPDRWAALSAGQRYRTTGRPRPAPVERPRPSPSSRPRPSRGGQAARRSRLGGTWRPGGPARARRSRSSGGGSGSSASGSCSSSC